MNLQRLSKSEFETALRRGQGRALMHVQHFGLADAADLVLDACLKDQRYEPSEPHRAMWLWWMFKDSAESGRFSKAIVDELEKASDWYDLQQLFDLANILAKQGNEEARRSVGRVALRHACSDTMEFSVGCDPWIDLEGEKAVIELARCFGKKVQLNPDARIEDADRLLRGRIIRQHAEHTLEQLSVTDPSIKAYLDFAEEIRAQWRGGPSYQQEVEQFRSSAPVQTIIDAACKDATDELTTGPYRGKVHYRFFAKHTTSEERELIMQRLLVEPNEQVCLRLLWFFCYTPLPKFHPDLLRFADSENEVVRHAAFGALERVQDKHIGAFARSRLQSRPLPEDWLNLLDLFRLNFRPGDELLISSAMGNLEATPENAHWACMSIRSAAREDKWPQFLDLLLWCYEHSPCTVCRDASVGHLIALKLLPDHVLVECLCDSNEDIRLRANLVLFHKAKGRCPTSCDELAAYAAEAGHPFAHLDHLDLVFEENDDGTCSFHLADTGDSKFVFS